MSELQKLLKKQSEQFAEAMTSKREEILKSYLNISLEHIQEILRLPEDERRALGYDVLNVAIGSQMTFKKDDGCYTVKIDMKHCHYFEQKLEDGYEWMIYTLWVKVGTPVGIAHQVNFYNEILEGVKNAN